MLLFDVTLTCACLLSGVAWAGVAASRSSARGARAAARPLLGGGAAFGIAFGAYELLAWAGADVRWEGVLAGGGGAIGLAALIGLVEEGAKLAGIALALERPATRGAVVRATIGAAAGFAALEGVVALAGGGLAAAPLARALLAPVAHAILAAPLGVGIALAARGGRGAWTRVVLGLLAAAALHAFADLSLASPRFGRLGYAAALALPAIALYVHGRRRLLAAAGR